MRTIELRPTNRPYAPTKITGVEMCRGTQSRVLGRVPHIMPTNVYGAGGDYHTEDFNAVLALIRRFRETRLADVPSVTVWESGTRRREFLYSEDMTDAHVHRMNLPDEQFVLLMEQDRNDGLPSLINIGDRHDPRTRELAETVVNIAGYAAKLEFAATEPDGVPRELLDVRAAERDAVVGKDHHAAWPDRRLPRFLGLELVNMIPMPTTSGGWGTSASDVLCDRCLRGNHRPPRQPLARRLLKNLSASSTC